MQETTLRDFGVDRICYPSHVTSGHSLVELRRNDSVWCKRQHLLARFVCFTYLCVHVNTRIQVNVGYKYKRTNHSHYCSSSQTPYYHYDYYSIFFPLTSKHINIRILYICLICSMWQRTILFLLFSGGLISNFSTKNTTKWTRVRLQWAPSLRLSPVTGSIQPSEHKSATTSDVFFLALCIDFCFVP